MKQNFQLKNAIFLTAISAPTNYFNYNYANVYEVHVVPISLHDVPLNDLGNNFIC